MKILAVGGGSGGHVTPVVAVLRELKAKQPEVQLRFWCDTKFGPQARGIMHHFDETIPVQTIASGKLRRYHNLPLWRQLLRPFTIVLPNIRDGFLVICGIVQSLVKLLLWKPDVIFTKGGFVCLPVGIAALLLRIPVVVHDSDAHPGLTNRILARWAARIGTGSPLKHYPYPKEISRYVGIPVRDEFKPVNGKEKLALKEEYGFQPERPLVVVTGGGLGAARINDATVMALDELLIDTSVLLISGTSQYDELRAITPHDDPRFQLHAFISKDMARLLNAADIVVTRAGATTLAELAILEKPTILVPNGYLTGGHQLKNAAAYEEEGAVMIIQEDELDADPSVLASKIRAILHDNALRNELQKRFAKFAKPHAARDVADMILEVARGK